MCTLSNINIYAACTMRVTIFSTGGKFRPFSIFMYLHVLTLVARSYVLLLCTMNRICTHTTHFLTIWPVYLHEQMGNKGGDMGKNNFIVHH